MKIDVFGGKDEIGGNKILLEHKDTRIFLDFGMSFKQAGLFFSEFLPLACIFTPHTLSSKYHSDTFHTIWYHPYMGGKKGYTARMAPSVVVVG